MEDLLIVYQWCHSSFWKYHLITAGYTVPENFLMNVVQRGWPPREITFWTGGICWPVPPAYFSDFRISNFSCSINSNSRFTLLRCALFILRSKLLQWTDKSKLIFPSRDNRFLYFLLFAFSNNFNFLWYKQVNYINYYQSNKECIFGFDITFKNKK